MLLTELLDEFATGAVEIQRRFDRAVQPSDAALGVPRMRLPSLAIDAQLNVTTGRSKGFSIAVSPFGLGFQLTHDVRSETLSRIKVTIEQTVLPLGTPDKQPDDRLHHT